MAGTVVVLSGASSVGKGKIRDLLLKDEDLNLIYAISLTTRPKKDNEVDGSDYYFTDTKSFAQAIKEKQLLEYTEFNGYYYGTPKAQVEFLRSQNKNVLIEVDAQGVGPIKLNIPDAICFFVVPEKIEDLEAAIYEKYKDDSASLKLRLHKAKMEMEISSLFNNLIENKDAQAAYKQIKNIILKG